MSNKRSVKQKTTVEPPVIVLWRSRTPGAIFKSVMRCPGAPEIRTGLSRSWTKWWIPFGVDAFMLPPETEWRPLSQLPPELNLKQPNGKLHVVDAEEEALMFGSKIGDDE